MKNERLFYLDFIRAIATISILLTHFNAVYLYIDPPMPEKVVITTTVANVYIGDFGVSLFFIISGAALMYVYQKQYDLKIYFKKRFLSIYPMFWLAYVIAFLFYVIIKVPIMQQAPIWKIVLTIIGFDGYLMEKTATFYILGEWFLGCIILMYLIFPIIRKFVLSYPKITFIIIFLGGVFFAYMNPFPLTTAKILFVRLPEFVFGMYFVKYIKKINLFMLFVSIVILAFNIIFQPNINTSIQTTYVGICSFIGLVWLSSFLKNSQQVVRFCAYISKYSYAIFLVHHVIIGVIMMRFNLGQTSVFVSYLLFLFCCILIIVAAQGLYYLNDFVFKILKVSFKNSH